MASRLRMPDNEPPKLGRSILVLPLVFFMMLLVLAAMKAAYPIDRYAIPEELQ